MSDMVGTVLSQKPRRLQRFRNEYSYTPGFKKNTNKNSCWCLKNYINMSIEPAENQLGTSMAILKLVSG